VHRTTLWRWLGQIKQRLLDDAMRRLRAELALDTAELASLCRLARSQLELSLGSLAGDA
jgi:hypothetical protein